MNHTRRILFLLLFVFWVLLTPNRLKAASDDSFFVDAQKYLEPIQSASEYDYPPFSIVEDGRADGFSVELLRASLGAVGMDVDFYTGQWSEIKQDLAEGKIDVLPLVGRTPEREPIYDFTVPYLSIYGNIFIRTDNKDIKNLDDLSGKKIAVMSGDNAEEFVQRSKVSSDILRTDTLEEAFGLLSKGSCDAVITQGIVGEQLIAKLGIQNVFAVSKIDNFKQDFTFAVKEGNTELLSRLNDGLSKIIINGEFDAIYNKWLAPIFIRQEIVDEEYVNSNSKRIADEINAFILSHPDMTLKDLQNNSIFKSIAVQDVSGRGYTVVGDSETAVIYFHPQKEMVNTDVSLLKDDLPEWWGIFKEAIGTTCNNVSGYFDWKEKNGELARKFMSLSCINTPTADGKKLFLTSTAYVDMDEGIRHIADYDLEYFYSSRLSVKQKAEDVAKQIEIYLKSNPKMTIKDLQRDAYFQGIAVQKVGQKGYTAITDYNTLIARFHSNPDVVDLDLNALKNALPSFWDIMSASRGGFESEGVYEWEEADGSISEKYMYIAIVDAKTADGVGLSVAATTYLDDYGDDFVGTLKDNDSLNYSLGDLNQEIAQEVEYLANGIETVAVGFERDIRLLAQTNGIKELLKQVDGKCEDPMETNIKNCLPDDKSLYWEAVSDYFLRFYKQNPDEIDLVRLFYKNGNIVVGINNGEDDFDDYKGDKSWFKDVINPEITESTEVYISPISIARQTNTPAIRYVLPIDVDGERLGLVVINFKARAIYGSLKNKNNYFFLDKSYENAEGDIVDDLVTILNDSKQENFILSEDRADASIIEPAQLDGDRGSVEFDENNEKMFGYYQKIDIPGHEWYLVSYVKYADVENFLALSQENKNIVNQFDYAKYIYFFISVLVIIFFILALLYYLGILKLERSHLLKILIIFFIIIGGMFIYGAQSAVNNLKNYFKKNYIEEHLQLEDILSDKILGKIDDINSELKFLAENFQSEACLNDECLNLLKGAYERNWSYTNSVTRIDSEGIVVAIYPLDEETVGLDISSQEHVAKVKKTMKPVFSSVFDSVQGFPALAFQYPVIKNGEFDGGVDFFINLNDFFGDLSLFKKHIHSHASFLLDSKGRIINSSYNEYLGKNILEIDTYSHFKNDLQEVLAENNSGYKELLLDNNKQIAIYYPVDIVDSKMTMIIFGNEKDAYLGLDDTSKTLWIFSVIALFILAFLFFVFSYFLNRSLRKEVADKTMEIRNTADFIKEQLKKEELISREKESLLLEQKKGKKILEEKVEELKKFNNLVTGRELRMRELKKELADLKKEVSKKKKKKI